MQKSDTRQLSTSNIVFDRFSVVGFCALPVVCCDIIGLLYILNAVSVLFFKI